MTLGAKKRVQKSTPPPSGSTGGQRWLEEFQARNGRPLRVLHFGNIANNAYNNAKVQRARGIEADVVAPDYYHVMGCPEWEDAQIKGDIADPFLPDFWAVDIGGFKRPQWFAQGPAPLCRDYLLHKAQGNQISRWMHWRYLQTYRYLLVKHKIQNLVTNTARPRSAAKLTIQRSRDGYRNFVYGIRSLIYGIRSLYRMLKQHRRTLFRDLINYASSLPQKIVHSVWKFGRLIQAWQQKILATGLFIVKKFVFMTWPVLKKITYSIHEPSGKRLVNFAKLQKRKMLSHYDRRRRKQREEALLHAANVGADERSHKREQEVLSGENLEMPDGPVKSGSQIPGKSAEHARQLHIKRFCKRNKIDPDDYYAFSITARFWQPLFEHYDIIQAYSTDPIWPFLSELKNYAAYEHGTIREIPFQDDPVGRLTKRAYLAAPVVFITNVDNIRAADRLGLSERQRFYLPHAFDCHKLLRYAQMCGVQYDADAPKQVMMPSRQHWVDGDPNWAKGNDNVIRAIRLLKDEGLSPVIKFVEWGRDVEESRKLIRKLGVEKMVIWSPMLNKQQLWEEYLRSMVVIDQFLLPGISGVSFEAMTLGVPVITHDEGGLNERFFGKAPPILAASNPEQVATQIKRLMSEEGLRETVGKKSTRWILDYHAPGRIFDIQIKAFRQLLKNKAVA